MGWLARTFLIISLVGLLGACASVDLDAPKSRSYAYLDTGDTRLGQQAVAAMQQHPGKSAFLLQTDGIDALATRLLLAARAERSIDVQYYLIGTDVTSDIFIGALIAAADRGVRVRLLLDDIFTEGYDRGMAALDAHPNFELRLFNPFAHRSVRTMNLLNASQLNRRMHNKLFVIDNQVAIIGGRNVGNSYFSAEKDVNFHDMDVVTVGPVVQEASEKFDLYWNDELAVPALQVAEMPDDLDAELDRLRNIVSKAVREIQSTPYGEALVRNVEDVIDLDAGDFDWASWELVYDAPEKAMAGDQVDDAKSIRAPLVASLESAKQEILVVSPYFVPTKATLEGMQALIDRGIKLTVVTNSLASTNHPVVHSGYVWSRKPMLEMGVELWEAKPNAFVRGTNESKVQGASATLHTKGFIVDGEEMFIGSFNWDPRSAYINTEAGIILKSSAIAGSALERAKRSIPNMAYQVVLTDKEKVSWIERTAEAPVVFTKEPQTGWFTRFKVGFYRLLPIKGQL